jgi:hypothetical protein
MKPPFYSTMVAAELVAEARFTARGSPADGCDHLARAKHRLAAILRENDIIEPVSMSIAEALVSGDTVPWTLYRHGLEVPHHLQDVLEYEVSPPWR